MTIIVGVVTGHLTHVSLILRDYLRNELHSTVATYVTQRLWTTSHKCTVVHDRFWYTVVIKFVKHRNFIHNLQYALSFSELLTALYISQSVKGTRCARASVCTHGYALTLLYDVWMTL